MSGGGGGGGSSTTVQSIPEELKPLATAYTSKAVGLSDQPYVPYTGQRYEPLNATQNLGIQSIQNRALNGGATLNNAESNLNQMMSGGSNPYLDAMYNKAARNVVSNYQVADRGSGSFGNSGLQESLGTGLADLATGMYGNAYAQDQNNRLQAIGMAPTINQAAYQPASQLLNAGQILQDQAQQNKDFAYQQFQEKQDLPYKQLAAMSGVFGSNLGSTSTTQQSGGGGK